MTSLPSPTPPPRRRAKEVIAWVGGASLSVALAFGLYSLASQPFTTTIDSPLALPKELVITSKSASVALPPLIDEELTATPVSTVVPQDGNTEAPLQTTTTVTAPPTSTASPTTVATTSPPTAAPAAPAPAPGPPTPSAPAPTSAPVTAPPETTPPTTAPATTEPPRLPDPTTTTTTEAPPHGFNESISDTAKKAINGKNNE